jgi:hypothetical protein
MARAQTAVSLMRRGGCDAVPSTVTRKVVTYHGDTVWVRDRFDTILERTVLCPPRLFYSCFSGTDP